MGELANIPIGEIEAYNKEIEALTIGPTKRVSAINTQRVRALQNLLGDIQALSGTATIKISGLQWIGSCNKDNRRLFSCIQSAGSTFFQYYT